MQPRNIYIVGAHCTGKTTLLQALKDHFSTDLVCEIYGQNVGRPVFIDEVAREVMGRDLFTADDVESDEKGLELQKRILLAQYRHEKRLAGKWFISDRSGIDPIIYAQFFLGKHVAEHLAARKAWRVLREQMQKAVVIVCEPRNEAWLSSDDGVRVKTKDATTWKMFGQRFLSGLREYGIEYTPIPEGVEDLTERVHFVEDILRSYRKSA
ncbi:AAA domain-containing protein [Aspergillus coremiiformis]|uniref:AAA domain-containing protein n=1 Tax=Aspergillus coremiiformis TaxID=138285 RepID=A0A5N6Z7Z8_9EURO|nr:AAA domain-containing protein [Aspergillus coremiiformis]